MVKKCPFRHITIISYYLAQGGNEERQRECEGGKREIDRESMQPIIIKTDGAKAVEALVEGETETLGWVRLGKPG